MPWSSSRWLHVEVGESLHFEPEPPAGIHLPQQNPVTTGAADDHSGSGRVYVSLGHPD